LRNTLLAASLLVVGLFAGPASSMPIGQVAATDNPLVQDVRYPCGRGFRPTPRGFCVPERRPPPRYDRYDRRDHWDRRGPPPREWRRDRRDWR
jgi:hypothetical protein